MGNDMIAGGKVRGNACELLGYRSPAIFCIITGKGESRSLRNLVKAYICSDTGTAKQVFTYLAGYTYLTSVSSIKFEKHLNSGV